MSSPSSGSTAAAAAGAALVVVLALSAPAGALDVKLWPLFRYARNDARDELRWSAFGPFIEFTRTAETRDLRIRPLLWLRQRRGPRPDDRADILYPLVSTRWQGDYQAVRFLLLSYRSAPEGTRPPAEDPGGPTLPPVAEPQASEGPPPATSRFTLLPFVFYSRSPERGARLSVLPFYLDEEEFLGYGRVQAVMLPAYLRVDEPRLERRYYAFPFVSTLGGPDGSGVRVWPLYGASEIAGRERTSYVLWPFHLRAEYFIPGYGWQRQRLNVPFFGAIDGGGVRSRAYGVLAYVHTVDERRGTESISSPWPFVVRERVLGESEYRVWRAFPFYGRSERDGISSRFWAWPAYRTKRQDADDFHYERTDVGRVLWRNETTRHDTSGHEDHLVTAFPFLRAQEVDGRHFGQVPAIADSLLPRNRGVVAMWAPVYGAFRWDTRPNGARDWNLLWGLTAREDGRLRAPWFLDYDATDAARNPTHGG